MVLQGVTCFTRVLHGFTGCHTVVHGVTRCYRVLHGFRGCYTVLHCAKIPSLYCARTGRPLSVCVAVFVIES